MAILRNNSTDFYPTLHQMEGPVSVGRSAKVENNFRVPTAATAASAKIDRGVKIHVLRTAHSYPCRVCHVQPM